MTRWELNDGRAAVGPLDEEHVLRMIAAGLPEATVVREAGAQEWRSIRSHAPFALAFAARAPQPVVPVPMQPIQAPPASYRWALFAGLGVAVGCAAIIVAVSAGKQKPASISVAPEPPKQTVAVVAPPPPKPTTPIERTAAAKTLQEALAVTVPLMDDTPNKSSIGTNLLAVWAMTHLGWKDVAVARDETTYARALKDIEAERGKRFCVGGVLIQIATERTDTGKAFLGLLMDDSGHLFHFIAVRSSGDLVANSPARFCGVLTGLYNYENSAGGEGHAVDAVGMFDLPENRK